MVDLDGRPPSTAFSERTGLAFVRSMEAINLSLFRLSNGRVGGTIWGSPVVLLTVSGRRTGIRRTKPLLSLPDGDAWIVVASRGGTTQNPDWFENLLAYEEQAVSGNVGTEDGTPLEPPLLEWAGGHKARVSTEALEGSDREHWWAEMVAVYPKFESYQYRTTGRVIPVARLTPSH
jgi:hypothetical protein